MNTYPPDTGIIPTPTPYKHFIPTPTPTPYISIASEPSDVGIIRADAGIPAGNWVAALVAMVLLISLLAQNSVSET